MSQGAIAKSPDVPAFEPTSLWRVIFASSLGTLFEWYDFYLYGSLAVFFGSKFFPPGNETAQLLASLATFGAGFGVRPLGALVFGYLGDMIGRKYTFLVTMATMGVSTAFVGLMPTYEHVGILATILLVSLRLLQGLALGGEYGGAATYVAEHVPDSRRGYYTSFIQTTATLGFFLSMGVIGTTRTIWGESAFKEGGGEGMLAISGWRIPFLLSFGLLAVSLYIRLKMNESPLFARLKSEKKVSVNPLKESFTRPLNLRYVLLALFGATAGQGVVWYTGQFYALTFMQTALKIDWATTYKIMSVALLFATPFFLIFGALSDRIGRKKVMLTGIVLAALTYVPLYMGMRHFSNPDLLPAADPSQLNFAMMVILIFIQMIYVTMVYGPIAAFLVELFPTNIRYTSMSLPYHLGNGWFGGFLPLIATALTTSVIAKQAFGDNVVYVGLIYPISICLITIVVGGLFIRETSGHKIDTALLTGAADEGHYDWWASLIALILGWVIVGVLTGSVLWGMLGGAGLFALPVVFFRFGLDRARSILTPVVCLAITYALSFVIRPAMDAQGGLAHFSTNFILIGVYSALLWIAYRMRTTIGGMRQPPAAP